MGYSIAKFHLWFKTPSEDSLFLTCVHGDLSPSNVFFKVLDGTVTFIDYSTFSCPERKDVTVDIHKFFNSSQNLAQGIAGGIYAAIAKKYLNDITIQKEYNKSMGRLQVLEKAIVEGYNHALRENASGFKLSRNDHKLWGLVKE